jgi:hypothetical protein
MNRTNYKLALPALLLLLITLAAKAQLVKSTDSLHNQISLYAKKMQHPILFIHFDKTIYTNNENVWFTGYLFNADYQKYKTLSLALIKDDERIVVMEDRFVIKNGLAFGNTFVPDSVGPGNYTFVATANRLKNGKPDVIFSQPITIKTEDPQSYNASLNPIDTSATAAQQKVLLLVNFSNPKEKPVSVPAWYYLGNTAHPILKDSVKIVNGQYVFYIPSKLLSKGNNRLHVQVKYKKEVKEISIVLPSPQQPANVRFYPEGGNLVNNIQSTVGWEVKSAEGKPLGVSAILYQDKKIIDTIETNSYGLGKFQLTPIAGSSYYVKLHAVNKKDTLYQLPVALTSGPTIAIANAVVNDTLTVNLKDEQHEKLYLIGHNYKQVFFTMPVNLSTTNKKIKFILKDVPKGLTQLTLTDSLGRPFAERIFFAHFNRRTPLLITPDKSEYTTRNKVTVKIRLDGKLDSGFVSVACVQENRTEVKKKNDIESYFYLKHDLEELPVRETYLGNTEADKQFLENVLLIKGWKRYTWVDLLKTEAADTICKFKDIVIKGNTTRFAMPLKKPVTLLNMSHPFNGVITDKIGNFTLNNNDILSEPNKKIALFIRNELPSDVPDFHQEYSIHVSNPYAEINKKLANQLDPLDYITPGQENTQYLQMEDNEHTIHLKEVKIEDKNDDALFFKQGAFLSHGANACGDYVCKNNILNCANHRMSLDNRPPEEGKIYMGSNGKPYKGCTTIPKSATENLITFKGIYTAQEFYPADYSKVNPAEPEYLSTLYWKYLVKVSSLKDTEFSFYTSDITGRYKIVVQGVTTHDVVYGEADFNITKKNKQ